ncbi:MAG: arylsulfatase, partial [Rhodopirellula sp. JB055]|uniref:arylsulfatase n=1 Tax=Rhodopirellula sp. JB055 TaxID=3342846 RepID=UPI00370B1799
MRIIPLFREVVVAALCLASWVGVGVSCRAESDSRPNVLVILTDDQGWGDLSLHGNPNLQTPHIDSLARDGVQIQNFYVCAVCSPTRAEFLTGRYHTRSGVFSTSAGGERIDVAERTIGDAFQEAGYATAAFGKWHSGMQAPYHPNSRGFEEFYGFCSGHWGNYFSPMLEHNGEIVQGKGFIVDDLTNHAIDFMEQHRTDPFFVYLPLNTPHSPMQVPDEDWKEFEGKKIVPDPRPENAKKEDVQHTRAALALCENIDDNVGRLLDALERLSLSENTIVVFFSDNGPNGSRFNGGLRGRKGAVHEGGLRSPCLIRYPAKVKAGRTVDGIAGAIDLFPTLADLCGVEVGATAGPLD